MFKYTQRLSSDSPCPRTYMRYLGLFLILISCNPFSSDKTDSPTKSFEMKGAWFLCQTYTDTTLNADCKIVDDDGIYFTDTDSAFRIDGALQYAKYITNDTTTASDFDINVRELYFFDEKQVFNGEYVIQGDTVKLNGYSTESGESQQSKVILDKQKSQIVLDAKHKYRKYNGVANLLTKNDWIQKIQDLYNPVQ